MDTSAINELFHQIDTVTTDTYSNLKSNLIEIFNKRAKIPLPLRTILNSALELISTILIVASVLGIYFFSGLHEWWIKLVGHVT